MLDASKKGVEIFRSLAVAVPAEQDFSLVPKVALQVGALKERNVEPGDIRLVKESVSYHSLLAEIGARYIPLGLRQARAGCQEL